MTDWKFDVPTTGTKHLPPDARYVEALSSQGYGLPATAAHVAGRTSTAKGVL